MKLVCREPETDALVELLATDPERVSSELAFMEVLRAVRRLVADVDPEGRSLESEGAEDPRLTRARKVLSRIALVRVDRPVLRAAAGLSPASLRSLDAIHLATALSISPPIGSLVTYDRRMRDASLEAGLIVRAPS